MQPKTVWVAFSRGAFYGEADPPGPDSFVGVYATREAALEHCWPKGWDMFVREMEVKDS